MQNVYKKMRPTSYLTGEDLIDRCLILKHTFFLIPCSEVMAVTVCKMRILWKLQKI